MDRKQYSYTNLVGFPLICLVFILGISGYFLNQNINELLIRWHQEKMVLTIEGISEVFDHQENHLDKRQVRSIVEHFNHFSGNRITVIAITGEVIDDSAVPVNTAHNIKSQSDRPEVIEALKGRFGFSTHISSITKKEMSYVAISSVLNEDTVVIRAAKSTESISHEKDEMYLFVITIVSITLVGAGIMGFSIIKYLNKQVNHEYEHLEERITVRTTQINRLQELGTMLSACNNKEESIEVIEKLVPLLIPKMSGALALFNASRDLLEIKAEWGEAWSGHKVYSANECWSLRTGREYETGQNTFGIPCKHLEGLTGHYFCIPLIAHGETLGVLHITTQSGRLSDECNDLVFAIGEQLGLAIANINLRRSLKEQATKDALTGLYNRRYLMDILANEVSRSERHHKVIGVLMMDLDHFKRFNDTYGHDCGDLVLSKLGSTIKKCCRDHDICCRYGGEEFTVILMESTIDNMNLVADRICAAVRSMEIIYTNQSISDLSISIGISVYPYHGSTPEQLLKEADKVLYQVKEEGRDGYKIKEIPSEKLENPEGNLSENTDDVAL
ncbi:diguanylate cyclase [Kiloniella sp.]|uniref:sensor domain-containing diguanylate cyclase n=1 Tax=Kiloniella sp. TaxID=1938587 RepID=UPI003B011B79